MDGDGEHGVGPGAVGVHHRLGSLPLLGSFLKDVVDLGLRVHLHLLQTLGTQQVFNK